MLSRLNNALFALSVSVTCALIAGCAANLTTAGTPVQSATISISPTAPSATVGASAQFQAVLATGTTSQDVTSSVTWQTSAAAVIANGSLICSSAGTFAVTAVYKDLVAQTTIACLSKPAPAVTGLHFGSSAQLVRSETPFQYQLLADLADGTTIDATSQANWSTDANIAAISSGGLFDCNNVGPSSVTASFDGFSVSTQTQCLMRSNPPTPGFLDGSSTFAGPFPSWTNVKEVFGAKGDGVTDDSDALRNAIASLSPQNTVLWLPRGTYLVSKSLLLPSLQNILIIGEDPRTTTLKWTGPVDETMLSSIGSTAIDIGRLTFDGGGVAGTDIDIESGGEYYPSYDYLHDLRLINSAKGLVDGLAGEATIERVHFANDSLAGVSLETGDAQNINIVDSLFTDCSRAVTNAYGGGGFYVSNSYFVRSTVADLSIGNTGPFSIRNNVSINSALFFLSTWVSNPSNIVIQGNTIVHPATTPIFMDSPGPMTLIDNRFLQVDPSFGLVLGNDASNPLQLLSIGNRFTVTYPFRGPSGGPLMNYTSIDEAPYDQDQDPQPSVPAEIYVPPPTTAPVFDIAPNSTDAQIHQVIANALSAGNSVVHFPAGEYVLDNTISIPSGANITLVGDGARSWLSASNQLQGPILSIQGKNVHVQNLQVGAGANEDAAVDVQVTDQPDSLVRCNDCATVGHANSLQVDGLDDAAVVVGVATLNSGGGDWGATIHGGPERQSGITTLGRVAAYGASTDAFQVDNSGHFLLEDGWHDFGQGPLQMSLTGKSVVAHEGGVIYTAQASGLRFNNYSGDYALVGVATDTNLLVDSSSIASVLFAGVIQGSGLSPIVNQSQSSSISLVEAFGTANNSYPYTIFSANQLQDRETEHRLRLIRSQYRIPLPAPIFGTTVTFNRLRTVSSPIGIHVEQSGQFTNGTYRIAPTVPSAQSSSCSQSPQITSGAWTLVDGGDESFGLLNSGTFLVEGPAGNGQKPGVLGAAAMASARARWFVVPNGDGTAALINRATGDRMTLETDGCTYAEPSSGAPNQGWSITNTSS